MSLSEHTPIKILKKGLKSLETINDLAEASEIMEQDRGLEIKYKEAIELLEGVETDNHYFCISFSTTKGNGHINISCSFYPSYNEVVKKIKESFSILEAPAIVSIMEMSKRQYEEWQK